MRMIIVWGWPVLSKLWVIKLLAGWTIKHFIERQLSLNLRRVWIDEPGSDLRAEWAQGRSICVRRLCVLDHIWYVLSMNFCVQICLCRSDWDGSDSDLHARWAQGRHLFVICVCICKCTCIWAECLSQALLIWQYLNNLFSKSKIS